MIRRIYFFKLTLLRCDVLVELGHLLHGGDIGLEKKSVMDGC